MPMRPAHACATCHGVHAGRCIQGQRQREQRRGTAKARGYNDARHRAWRRAVLAKSNGLCVACLAIGRPTVGRVADHIVPRECGGEQYDEGNGQALCDPCHAVKRSAESRGRHLRVVEGKGLQDAGPLPRRIAA